MAKRRRALGRWVRPRQAPLIASVVLVTLACCFIPKWTGLTGTTPGQAGGWFIPGDLWGTQLAARAVAYGHLNQVYSPSTGLIAFPAVAALLAPAVDLARVFGWATVRPGTTAIRPPTGWLPILIVTVGSALPVLFATDGLAEFLAVSRFRRLVLAGIEAVAVWNVVVWWGHPEDALGVAFLVFATTAAFSGRWHRCGWLLGAAIAFQPLVLLALPVLATQVPSRQRFSCALRAAVPSVILLFGPLVLSWHDTVHALVGQPNFPSVDHATPWTTISPTLAGHQVAAGPLRFAGLLLVAAVGWWLAQKVSRPEAVLWFMSLALASRLFFEPVLVAYYVWPVLCLGLVAAAHRSWWRLVWCGVLSTAATVFGDAKWRGNWSWWAIEVALIGLFLSTSWPKAAGVIECVAMNEPAEAFV
jgi:hypothetical protein